MDSAGRTQAFQAWEQLDGEWRTLGFGGAVAVRKGGEEGHGASRVIEQLPAGSSGNLEGAGAETQIEASPCPGSWPYERQSCGHGQATCLRR